MQVVIRADASLQIGSGHLARCLALAEELRTQGAEVHFFSRALAGHLLGLIGEAGFKLSRLEAYSPTDEEKENFWFGGKSWEEDAAECISQLNQLPGPVDWLLVDHYGIDERWEARLRPHVGKIAVIDDLANRHHDCDLLIDQNLRPEGESRYAGKVPAHCQVLEGMRYALLRSEFRRERGRLASRDGKVNRVLVLFGGMDHLNQTAMVLQVLEECGSQLWIDAVIGASNPHHEEIRQWCAGRGNIHLHCQTSNIAGLMAAADLCVGAGGVTMLERCALGLPTVVIAAAANQISGSEQLSQHGAAIYLGMHDEVSPKSLRRVLAGIMEMPGLLRTIGSRCQQLVDAGGAERVARQLMLLPGLLLRPAGPEDCQLVFEWRNDAQARRFSHNQEEIPLVDHESWFTRSLANPRLLMIIAESGEGPAGVLRYDLQDTVALVSINLAPRWRGYGLGAAILRLGSGWVRSRFPELREIRAEILAGNPASARAFADAGYQPYFSTYRKVFERVVHGNADFNREA